MALPIFNLKINKTKSLVTLVKNAIKGGDNYFFRNLWANLDGGEEVDILQDGKNSCAVFVSWILLVLELIKHPHASVDGTIKDMIESGWIETDDLRPGAVVSYEKLSAKDDLLGVAGVMHGHIGFYIGNDRVISNSSKTTGFPSEHHVTYNDTRKIEKIYWNSILS